MFIWITEFSVCGSLICRHILKPDLKLWRRLFRPHTVQPAASLFVGGLLLFVCVALFPAGVAVAVEWNQQFAIDDVIGVCGGRARARTFAGQFGAVDGAGDREGQFDDGHTDQPNVDGAAWGRGRRVPKIVFGRVVAQQLAAHRR